MVEREDRYPLPVPTVDVSLTVDTEFGMDCCGAGNHIDRSIVRSLQLLISRDKGDTSDGGRRGKGDAALRAVEGLLSSMPCREAIMGPLFDVDGVVVAA